MSALRPDPVGTGSAWRPWALSTAAAIAVGLPLIVATAYGEFALGALGALGALVILHLPPSSTSVPMGRLTGCAVGVAVSPFLGQLATMWPQATVPLFGVLIAAIVATTRAANLPPPGHTFFVLGACGGAAEGFHPSLMPYMLLVPAAGAVGALLIALAVRVLWFQESGPGRSQPAPVGAMPSVRAIWSEALAFGFFGAAALAIAQWLGLDRPYWVPISCVAVMRGVSLESVGKRNVDRIVGTLVGVCLTVGLLVAEPRPWTVVAVLVLLVFGVHRTMGQRYAITVLLATPASLMLAEMASADRVMELGLLITRVKDIALGSVIGLVGGTVLHGGLFRRGDRA